MITMYSFQNKIKNVLMYLMHFPPTYPNRLFLLFVI